jgi:hypothetical protein
MGYGMQIGAMAGTNLNAHSGETLSLSFSCKDEDGAAFNLTGYSARAKVRSTIASSVVVIDLTPTIPNPANGIIVVSKTDEQTANVPPGVYQWDLVLDTPSGGVIYIAGGTIKFRQIASRS